MRSFFKKIFQDIEVFVSGLFLTITVSIVILNVILRYLFQGGLYWVEEVSTTCFIWSVFIGAAAAYKYKMHIGIDLITALFPEKIRELISIIINFLMVVINGYIFYLSTLFIQANSLKRTPVLDVPALYVNLAITVGFGLMTIHAAQFLYREIRLFFGFSKLDSHISQDE
ncbi:TRAP transporter small permease [Oceanispirochaeta crateris]|jgi:TRAP-type C4-dicarboxylate transport system permease small subunit|uniref:TRAP transporter small permease n=1 Tax=Oceanispirochaeta crateris TaxID=2518645 RepID=A0A5C1QH92_9SPIO|nr:TRAP transporter small permease [Oceanispirochaeta crateris]QEN06867.1 TRAP transporter small permease [Oceanispirochaeta crateris]